MTGVIPRKKQGPFERVLWRSLRGNLFMNQSEVKETIKNHLTVIFLLFFFLKINK